ncbi:Phosphomannomutase [Serinicoccus hydrothermalis]|uniref:Phosphomannomutase n=1 Tax=Serinicoccus hydrothermalis TaxID=1758689 RepID=A0A1B1NAG1_9MICO|nr:phosphomannomutase/phosphoglucomutase [Serinicoccus hydrothermalis]ANS78423.1 Phosphomannomutase [Serinicoccus hydrothermalis]
MRLAEVVKAYDVRGLVPEQLDATVARALGSAFAQVVVRPEGQTGIVLGRDMRESSPELAAAFADGVLAQGVDVTDIGLCSTDGLYHASGTRSLPGAMVTASHNAAGYNGIKLCRAGAAPVGHDSGLAEVRDLAQWLLDRGEMHRLSAPSPGRRQETDLLHEYAAHLHSLVDVSGIRPLHVVVDAGNGMAGHTVPVVLGVDGLPLRVDPLHFELDGTFPHHDANPLDPANQRELQDAVLARGADLGLAFDGDADRVFVVDERGHQVPAGALTCLLVPRLVARAVAAGQDPADVTVVHGSILPRAVEEGVAASGARLVTCRVGHTFVKAAMARHGAVFGAEHSGHYYFRDFWSADSGLLAVLHLLATVGEQDLPVSQLLGALDPYAASGEISSAVRDVAAVAGRVRRWALDQGAVADDTDGMLMRWADGTGAFWWFSLRASNTEPLLRLTVEALDGATMEQVRDAVLALLEED